MKLWNLLDFAGDESGATMIEYAVVLSFVCTLIFGSINSLGLSLDGVFASANAALTAANGGGPRTGSGPGNGNGNNGNPGNGGGNTSGSGPGTGNGGGNNGQGGGAGNGGGGGGNGGV